MQSLFVNVHMRRTFTGRLRFCLLGLLLLSLFFRLLTPAGYMPAALATGGPLILCPDGLPGIEPAASTHHGAHGDHAGHGGNNLDPAHHHGGFNPDVCPVGAVLGAAMVPVAEVSVAIPFVATQFVAFDHDHAFTSITSSLYYARGPPLT